MVTAVDTVGDVGTHTSIAIGTDGLPVISYYDATNQDLKVAKCGVSTCASSSLITAVDATDSQVGEFTSIAIDADGLPVISYYDFTDVALKVAKCRDPACTSAQLSVVDHLAYDAGMHSAIVIGRDGLPVISYLNDSSSALMVARCNRFDCSGAASIYVVDDSDHFVGTHTSIAIGAGGNPVISYYDSTAESLKLALCADPACSTSATLRTLDSVPGSAAGLHTSIAVGSDGLPAISYSVRTGLVATEVRVAKCLDVLCASAPSIVTLDAGNDVGLYTALALGTDGNPTISYLGAGDLRIARCSNRECSGSIQVTVVDPSPNDAGHYTDVAIAPDKLPVISYRDEDLGSLMVAKCVTPACAGSVVTERVFRDGFELAP